MMELQQAESNYKKIVRPMCYINRVLTADKLKNSITVKEAVSLVGCIEKLHLYL